MVRIKDAAIAEQNVKSFTDCLRGLAARQGGGLEWYEVRGSSVVEYDPMENKLYKSIELHGYRPHSLTAKQYLTATEEDDIMYEVELGLIMVYAVSSFAGNTVLWKGSYNMEVVK